MARSETILCLVLYLISYECIHAQNPIGLRAVASPRGLILGTEAPVPYLRGNADMGQYISYLKGNNQLIVPASAFMPTNTWMGDNQYNFTDTDWLLGATSNSTGWIQQNGMLIRAHALVWGNDIRVPTWLLEQEASITPEKAKALLSDFIHTIVSRYQGKILWWNVINEAISDRNETQPFNLRNSFWYRKLGADFIKYAFTFAHEADPSVKLFYNEYSIEHGGLKANSTLALIDWLQSQGIPIYGLGMQWHIDTSEIITPGDGHYQIAQQFIDKNLILTVSELDVGMSTKGAYPINPDDLQKQATVYRSLLQYVLHFFPKIPSIVTWGFTDRYSFVSTSSNYTRGDALPRDCQYQPKPAYWQLLEELARVVSDGIYRLSPQSQPEKCLGTSGNGTNSTLQLYDGNCNNTNQKWNVTWLGDGTYRFSPESANSSALNTYNATAPVGEVVTSNWTANFNQEWVITPQVNNTYRISPRNGWWRVLTVYETSSVGIVDYSSSAFQYWILTKI